MTSLDELIDFLKFTHQIRNVERAIVLENYDRHENDVEHMYQLALTAWYLIEALELKLDKSKAVGMALVHDVTEVYSGDTNAHASAKERIAHEKRSEKASETLKKDWPALKSFHGLVDEYQRRQTPEAKFIYALDKLLPVINIYLYEGRSWKQQGIDFEEMQRVKVGKVDLSPEVKYYYDEIVNLLKSRPEIFGAKVKS